MFCGKQRKKLIEETESEIIDTEGRHRMPVTVQQGDWELGVWNVGVIL
jgi:hypothetical protein